MKKVFALLAITSVLVACYNSSESTEPVAGTTVVVAPADTTASSVLESVDSTTVH